MDEIYKIATNEDTIPLFDLRSMIHYSMGTPLPKTKIRLTNYRYYTPKYPSEVLTTPIILLKNPIFRLFSEQDDATDAEQEGRGELRPVESEHRIGPNSPGLLVAAWFRVLCVIVGMHLCC